MTLFTSSVNWMGGCGSSLKGLDDQSAKLVVEREIPVGTDRGEARLALNRLGAGTVHQFDQPEPETASVLSAQFDRKNILLVVWSWRQVQLDFDEANRLVAHHVWSTGSAP